MGFVQKRQNLAYFSSICNILCVSSFKNASELEIVRGIGEGAFAHGEDATTHHTACHALALPDFAGVISRAGRVR